MISVSDITVCFAEKTVLDGFSLAVPEQGITALSGPSGCGKTTLLNTISGIVRQDAGQVLVDGRDISHSPIEKRNIGVVFQNYALFAHMNVFENVAYPLRLKKVPKAELQQRVGQALETVRLDGYAPRRIAQLSGGEQQRVAIARALAKNPKLLLCDEPTGALDYVTGKNILKLLQDTCRRTGMTVVIITHNSALTAMADRVISIKSGTIQSVRKNEHVTPVEEIEW